MQYYVKFDNKIEDFISIQPFDEELERALGRDKGMTFRQAKREAIKIHLRRVTFLKGLTEKEYNGTRNSRTR